MEEKNNTVTIKDGIIAFPNGSVALEDVISVEVKNEPSLSSLFFFVAATLWGIMTDSIMLVLVGLLNVIPLIMSLASYNLTLKTRQGAEIKVAQGGREEMMKLKEQILEKIQH